MKSKEVNIIQLNDYCLEIILEYLTMEDHLNFADTCCHFRHVFMRWASHSYINFLLIAEISVYEFKILSVVSKSIQKLSVDVDDLICSLATNYAGKQKYFFTQFCKLIGNMHQLQSLNLWQSNKKMYAKRILINARNLPNLKRLQVHGHKCGNAELSPFKQLELLSLDVQLSSKALLKSCKLMTNLRELHMGDHVGTSRLRDIIEQCPHLEELSFSMQPQKFEYCTVAQGGCAAKIFGALADRTQNLLSLNVRGIISDLNQAEQLARISSLRRLCCSFSNPDCARVLRQLSLLEELRISLLECTADISEIYLELIRTCTRLRLLRIFDFNIHEDFVIKVSKVLGKYENRCPMQLFIYGHRESMIMRTSKDIDTTQLIYRRMNAQELIKLLLTSCKDM